MGRMGRLYFESGPTATVSESEVEVERIKGLLADTNAQPPYEHLFRYAILLREASAKINESTKTGPCRDLRETYPRDRTSEDLARYVVYNTVTNDVRELTDLFSGGEVKQIAETGRSSRDLIGCDDGRNWRYVAQAGDPCHGVTCPQCHYCQDGSCFNRCGPDDVCNQGTCIGPGHPSHPNTHATEIGIKLHTVATKPGDKRSVIVGLKDHDTGAMVAGLPVEITVADSTGERIYSSVLTTNAEGYASTPLYTIERSGIHTVTAVFRGGKYGDTYFTDAENRVYYQVDEAPPPGDPGDPIDPGDPSDPGDPGDPDGPGWDWGRGGERESTAGDNFGLTVGIGALALGTWFLLRSK